MTGQPYVSVGAGQLGGAWPASPAGNPLGWFSGQVQDVSFLNRPLGLPAVQQEYSAGTLAVRELVRNSLPSGKVSASLTYDVVADRVATLTTGDGGTYRFGSQVTNGSTNYYRGAVLSTRPNYGYPLSDTSGTVAGDTLGLNPPSSGVRDGVYSDVVLGAPGIFGPSGDSAASFNGTSSYLALPSAAFDDSSGSASVALWFRTRTAGGVLFSYQNGPIGNVLPGNYTPALYVGSDGKLRGQFWDDTLDPMTSSAAVNDGNWHMVVLTASGTTQTLWLDGTSQANHTGKSIAGRATAMGQTTVSVGAGYTAGWPMQQSGNPQGWFNGQIAQVALYALNIDQITPGAAGALYRAKGSSSSPTPTTTVSITEPGGGTASISMDPANGMRTTAVTNSLGQTTAYTFDTQGNQAGVTDPNGHSTTRVFDTHGNALQQTTCQTVSSCQTSYDSYLWNTADPIDPTNGKIHYGADGRAGSSGTANAVYRTSYTYTPGGRVATMTTPPTPESPSGRTTTYTYTTATTPALPSGPSELVVPAGLLASVTDPRGLVTTYQYWNNGQLGLITEPSGQQTKYTYDGYRGTLIQKVVTSDAYPAGLTTALAYDDQNRLVDERLPTTTDAVTGHPHTAHIAIAYDDDGNVSSKSIEDWGQVVGTWVSDGDGRLVQKFGPATGQTWLDPTRTTTYTFNAGNRLDILTNPAGDKQHYTYDAFGRSATTTAVDGLIYSYGYSPVGDLLTTTLHGWTGDPGAPTAPADLVVESRAYDPGGRLASVTDAMGRTTGYAYFDDDRLQSVTEGVGTADAVVAASYTYDAAGNRATECTGWTPAHGCSEQIQDTVDAAGRIAKTVTDPTGANIAVTRTFDPGDNVLSQTMTGGGQTRTVAYGYDTAGRRTSEQVTNGSQTLTTKMGYDQRGLMTSVIDPRGNAPGASAAAFTTTYRYDEAGRPVGTVSPPVSLEEGGATAVQAVATALTGYDTFGDVLEVDDPNGDIQTNTYDTMGRLAATVYSAYTAPGSSTPISPTVRYGYDKLGQLRTLTDPRGRDQTFTYDQLGNQVTATLQDGRTSRSSFDTVGEALSTTDPSGARSESTYNSLGQPITATQAVRGPTPAAYTTTYGYDAAGNQTSATDPLGKTTSRTYSALGLISSQTDPVGDSTGYEYNLAGQLTKVTAADGTATSNVYDQAGRLTKVSELNAAGTALRSTSFGYDGAGNPVSAIDPRQITVTATYDALNRTVSQNQPGATGQTIVTSFGYDASGNRTRYTDPNGNATIYTYNPLGLRESSIAPSVAGQTSAADRTTWLRYDPNGRLASITQPGGVTVNDAYDDTGRLIGQSGTGAEAPTANRTFGYDDADHLTSASSPAGIERFTYDDRGLMLTSSMSGWSTSFGYDANGRIKTQTDPNGVTEYAYDDAGRLSTQADALTGQTVTFGYNKVNQQTGITYGNGGATRTYGYDDLHQLSSDVLKNPAGAVEASTAYGYDPAGHLNTKTTAGFAGSGSNTYSYDNAGRLSSWTSGSATTGYGYDAAGNRTQAGSTTYAYNARSELTSANTGSNTTTYSYTSRGTTSAIGVGASTTQVTSDAYNQQVTEGSAGYAYDALGRIASVSTSTGTSSFAYDDLSNNMVSDGKQKFDYTPDGTPLSVGAGSASSFANVDRHGDVTGTLTATGSSLSSSATYDPNGNVTASAGARPDIGYQSGWTDPTSGFVNAASRWYNPVSGTFTSADSQENDPSPAVNANPYAYGNDDSLDNSDPTGHDPCSAQLAAEARAAADEKEREAGLRRGAEAMLANANAVWQRGQAIREANQREASAEQAHRSGQGNPSYDRQRTADRNSSARNSQSQSGQNSSAASGGKSSGMSVWGWVGVGAGAVLLVGVAILLLPEEAVVGVGLVAGDFALAEGGFDVAEAAQWMFALAASDATSCTTSNAPHKPSNKPPTRTTGPVQATGPTQTAAEAAPDLPDSVSSPNEAPGSDTLAGSAQAQLDDACFSGALQRSDGTRSAGVWECGDTATAGDAALPADAGGGNAAGSAGDLTRVFRVESPGNARLDIDAVGNVSIKGSGMLFLNFGDQDRAHRFLAQRLAQGFEGTVIKSFDVPTSYANDLAARAVPESMARGNSVISVDPTKTASSLGLRSSEFRALQCAIIPRSAC